ncbi:MAG: ATP-binding protein, partial [Colwellia sp.]|nr:ATP-binding protein [Colwellia sp.]
DSQGNIWLGTGDGLNYFNPKNKLFTHYRHQASNPNSLSDSNIFSIIEDSQSNLWLGTRDGLNYFNTKNGQVSHYRHKDNDPNSLSYNTVFSILEDNIGNLWIGTRGGGLNHFNPRTKQFTHYRHQRGDSNTLGNDTIFSIVEDNLGNLWVGTPDGLNYFNKKTEKFKHYTTKNGLPNNVIYRIEEDNQGYIWLSTNQGLSRMDPETETFKNFDAGDGLQSNEFNFGASFKSKSGELYFGGINGFNRFYPENITDDQNPPKVLITEMLLLNESVPIGLLNPTTKNEGLFTLKYVIHETKEITLTHTDNIIAFEFAALHFINPKKNQFSYQLVGWDKDWVSTDYKNRRATYTNLPGGDYTFRVKASNSDGYWNEEGASLQITVLPPPWKTWWAYTGYGLIILSLILTFVRSQRKKVLFERHLNAQLEDKVLARTIELEEKNSEILSTQKQLIQSSKMASIGTMTAGVAHEINNPTNFTHAATYLMNDEIFKIKSFLKQLAGGDNADPEVLQSVEHQFTKLVELINTANEGTTRIKTIVEDLRTFARLDDAKQAQVNVADLINSTIHLVRTQYDSIVIETQFDYQPLLTCFPSKLNQVFMNIIINACQAINQKKQIDKQRNKQSNKDFEGRVIIKTSQDDNRLMLTFEDNGCGMTEQTIHRLFEPFFTTKDVGSGTGLGMAISFGIIEEHHGFIEVESTVNEGTKIIIHFDV